MKDTNILPLFYIIIPCYNSERFLENAIDSVINQTYHNWKLILVNDGSTDRTLEMLHDYSVKDSRIKVYSKENGGYATAINYALDKISESVEDVNNSYFLMLGSDDSLQINLLENIVLNLKETLPDCIAFKTIKHKQDNTTEYDEWSDFTEKVFSVNTNFKEFSEVYPDHSKIFFMRDTSKIYKTSLLGKLRYFGTTGLDSDTIFSMLFCHKATSFLVLPIEGYNWVLRQDSVSATFSVKKLKDRLNNWVLFYKELSNEKRESICMNEIWCISAMLSAINSFLFNPVSKKYRLKKELTSIIRNTSAFILKFLKKYKFNTPYKKRLQILKVSVLMYILYVKIISKKN